MNKILMVCLGNICRSTLAEGVMQAKIDKYKLDAMVDSAGTANYHVGQHPDPRSIACGQKHNIDISKQRGRQFTKKDFDNFTHIFVMDASNYADVLLLANNEEHKSKVQLIRNVVAPNKNLAVPDPYWGDANDFEAVYQTLDECCEVIAHTLQE